MASKEYYDAKNFTTFRDNLTHLLATRGYAHNYVAASIGLTDVSLSRYKSGDRTPELLYAARLAQFFNVSLEWLIGFNGTTVAADEETQEFVEKFSKASDNDKSIILAILKKY